MTWIAVALGGAAGSLARHAINMRLAPSPAATAVVNLLGCATIGLLAGLIAGGALRMTPHIRAFVFVGILGGFTTFSSFALDTLVLVHGGRHADALANAALQVVAGIALTLAGYALGVAVPGR